MYAHIYMYIYDTQRVYIRYLPVKSVFRVRECRVFGALNPPHRRWRNTLPIVAPVIVEIGKKTCFQRE